MKAVVLALLVAVTLVGAAELFPAVDVSDSSFGLDRDTELAGDSPLRQAQRMRTNERVKPAEASFLQTEAHARAGAVPGPALNRLTGAAKTYHPNDQMCVLCQFLVQRTQLDMAHFNVLGGFQGVKAAGANGKENAAAGGGDAGAKAGTEDLFFLEMGSSFADDEASQDWEAEDAEDAAAMELAAKQELAEADGDWDTVAALEAKSHAIETVVAEHEAEAAAIEGEDEEDSEEEEEEEGEEEEETEEKVANQLAASAFSETSSTVLTEGLTAQERAEMAEVMDEMRNDKVADSVSQQIAEGMESTPVMVEADAKASDDSEFKADEEEVTADMISNGDRKDFIKALGKSFDSELDLSADEREDMSNLLNAKAGTEADDYASPAYNADGSAEPISGDSEVVEAVTSDSEDAVFLQVDEAEEAEDAAEESEMSQEEAEFDASADEAMSGIADNVQLVEVASNANAARSYARVLHRADYDSAFETPIYADVSGPHASFRSAGGLARRRSKSRAVGVANSPRRFRLADALNGRPRWNRWDPTVKPHPDPARAQARQMWHHLMQMTYDRLEGYCSTRLPEQFTPFCRPLLRRFRVVAEGIRYGDRPNQICMRTKFCPRGSYVRRSPHNVFKHVRV